MRTRTRATRSCCRPPARASTCSAITRRAETPSRRPRGRCRHERRRVDAVLALRRPPAAARARSGTGHRGLRPVARGPGDGGLGLTERRRAPEWPAILLLSAPAALGIARPHRRRGAARRADQRLEAARALAPGRELRAAR